MTTRATEAVTGQNQTNQPLLALDEAAGHLIRRTQQRHTMVWNKEFGGDITGPQYAVISAVAGQDGLDQRAVGERASLDKSSTADIVARLEGQGWLRLSRDPADGRRNALRLTPLARTALGEVSRRVQLVQEQLLSPIPAKNRDAFLVSLRLVAYAGDVPPQEQPTSSALTVRDTAGHLIRRAQQVHTVFWGTEVGRALTAPQYAVLSALREYPEGIDQSAAGELASLDRSSMADVVQRLVKRGWVARTRATADARRRILRLTETVQGDLLQLTPAVQRVQDRLLAPLETAGQRETFQAGCRALAYAGDANS